MPVKGREGNDGSFKAQKEDKEVILRSRSEKRDKQQ